MSESGGLAERHGIVWRRARINGNLQLAADLLVPALLIGLLRVWSLTTAPKQGVYFTAEVLLIAYAYFSVIRGAHIHAQSRDWEGRYDRGWATRARGDFYRGLRRYWLKIALVLVPLLSSALLLDMLTANSGFQLRLNVHLSMLFIGLMAWARYGAAIVLAAARWSPPRPPAFSEARELASRAPAARSFALLNLGLNGVAVAAVLVYKWAGVMLPTARAELVCLIVLFTFLAWLALWLHCRWSAAMLVRIGELVPATTFAESSVVRRAAETDCPAAEATPASYMVAPICQGTNSLSP